MSRVAQPYSIRELPDSYSKGFLKAELQNVQRAIAGAEGDTGIYDVEEFGSNVGKGNDDTKAFQKGLSEELRIRLKPGTSYSVSGDLSYNYDGQCIEGNGDTSVISYTGAGTLLSFNGKKRCGARNFKYSTTTGVNGIDLPFASHWWGLYGLHGTGFSGAAVQGASSYYGELAHCDLETNGYGLRGISDFNGNSILSSSMRQNLYGVSIENTPSATDATILSNLAIESARVGTQYGVQLLGATGVITNACRMELTQGLAHVFVNSQGANLSQFNQFLGCPLEGTIGAYTLGDGVGVNQVLATYISGGRGAGALTFNSDCIYTRIESSPSAYGGVLTDNSYGSIVLLDPTNAGKWYIRTAGQNSGGYNVQVGGVGTIHDVGGNTFDVKNTSGTSLRVEVNGRVRAPIGSLSSGGDSGGLAGTVTLPNAKDIAVRGAGAGTVLFNDGVARNSVGMGKIYYEGVTYWVPLFDHS